MGAPGDGNVSRGLVRGHDVERIELEFMTSFEKVCSTCRGYGQISVGQPSKWVECPTCVGRGIIPNDMGDNLIAFLRRYGLPTL